MDPEFDISYLVRLIDDKDAVFSVLRNKIIDFHNIHLPYIKKRLIDRVKSIDKELTKEQITYEQIRTQRPVWNGSRDEFIEQLTAYLIRVPQYYRLQEFNELMKDPAIEITIDGENKSEYNYTYSDMLKLLMEGEKSKVKRSIVKTTDNPFYVHIDYEINHVDFNKYIESIQRQTYNKRFIKRVLVHLMKNKAYLKQAKTKDDLLRLANNEKYLTNLYNLLRAYNVFFEKEINPTFSKKRVIWHTGKDKQSADVDNKSTSRAALEQFFDVMNSDLAKYNEENARIFNFEVLKRKNLRLVIPRALLNKYDLTTGRQTRSSKSASKTNRYSKSNRR